MGAMAICSADSMAGMGCTGDADSTVPTGHGPVEAATSTGSAGYTRSTMPSGHGSLEMATSTDSAGDSRSTVSTRYGSMEVATGPCMADAMAICSSDSMASMGCTSDSDSTVPTGHGPV